MEKETRRVEFKSRQRKRIDGMPWKRAACVGRPRLHSECEVSADRLFVLVGLG